MYLSDGAVSYSGSINPYGQAAFSVPVYLDRLACTGDEMNLDQCGSTGVGMVSGCAHDQDSAVSCQIKQCEFADIPTGVHCNWNMCVC